MALPSLVYTTEGEVSSVAVFSTQVLTEILPGTRLFPYSGVTVLKLMLLFIYVFIF